jgi:cytochrome P450
VVVDIAGTRLLDPSVIEDPYPFYRDLHEHAPVWLVPGTQVVIVSSFALVSEAVGRVEDFSSNLQALLYRDEHGLPGVFSFGAAGGGGVLATADPPAHTLHRSVVFPELMAKRMAALEPEILDLAAECVKRAVDAKRFDFMAEIGNLVPITVISRLIGFSESDPHVLLSAAADSTAMFGATVSEEELWTLVARTGEISGWIAGQVMDAANHPSDDTLLGTIARGIEAESLRIDEGVVILHTLLSAGGESTTSLLGNAVRLLAEQPELQEQLRQQPELIPAFAEEVLRLESPFRYLTRSVPKDTTLGGVDIPQGATMLLFWGAANRDESEYERADEVVLDRPAPRHHVAFGRGIHLCVGAPLARLEARAVLTTLLEHTSDITLDPARPPKRIESLLVRRHDRLPVQVASR